MASKDPVLEALIGDDDCAYGCAGGGDLNALTVWIEKLAEMVERQQGKRTL